MTWRKFWAVVLAWKIEPDMQTATYGYAHDPYIRCLGKDWISMWNVNKHDQVINLSHMCGIKIGNQLDRKSKINTPQGLA